MNEGSKSFQLNKADVIKLVKNTVLVGLAAGLTFFGENLANVNLGPSSALIVPVVALAINTFVRWITDYTK